MSAELGVTHLGAATDIFSIFARLRTPIWNKFAANVKYGASFANSRIRGVYSGGIDYFANRKNSIGIQYSRQYTYTQLEAVKGQGNAYPTDWFTDIKYMQPIRLLALKYTRYMDRCDSSCWRERPPVYARGEYVGFGLAELSRHLGFGYYQNNPLNDNVDTGSSYAGQETDNMLGYELIHGNQITPYFGMEFGVAGSSKENYLNFYTVSGRFTIPLLSSIRPYVKFGALYTNETDFVGLLVWGGISL